MSETLLEQITQETETIKKQQEDNLREYSKKLNVMEEQYNELLEQKNAVQKFLDNALFNERAELNKLIVSAKENFVKSKKVLGEAETVNSQAKEIKNKSEIELEETLKNKEKNRLEYKKKTEAIAFQQEELSKSIESLKRKHETVDNIKAILGEDRIKLNDLQEKIKKERNQLDKDKKDHAALVEYNESILATNKVTLERINEKKNESDRILQEVQQENAQLIKRQEDIAFRERELEKSLKEVSIREDSVETASKEVERMKKEANELYTTLKNKT